MNARNKAWAKANPERINQRAKDRQARVNGWKPSDELKQQLFQQQRGRCGLCGEPMDAAAVLDASQLQVEHLTPTIKGGSNERSNLVLAHRTCNQEKAGKTWAEYIAWRAHVGLPIPSII